MSRKEAGTVRAERPGASALYSQQSLKLFSAGRRTLLVMSFIRQTLFHLPRTPLLASMAAGLFALSTLQAEEQVTQKVFPVASGGRLVMNMDRGSIEIETAETNAVGITITREVKRASDRKAAEILENHKLEFSQEGNVVQVKGRMSKGFTSVWNGNSFSVRCKVTVPRQFDLNLDTAGGSIKVSDLTGKVDVETAGGSISLGTIQGGIKAQTAGGSISVEGATEAVHVGTAGGSIKLGAMGGAVDAETSGGSIRILSASGPVKVGTSGGSIELGDMTGPVQAETSGGSINARFPKSSPGDIHLETSGGSISVYLGEDASYQLDAECSGGRVSTDLPVTTQGKLERSELHGQIGKGGPKMVLRTSGGGISLKKWVAAK